MEEVKKPFEIPTGPCSRCGDTETPKATVYSGGREGYYCHESTRSCYELSTWQGYPELRPEGDIL